MTELGIANGMKEKALAYLDAIGVAAGLNPTHKLMFIELCAKMGLNPLLKEVYAVPYLNRITNETTLTVIVGYQEFLKRAERTGLLNSWHVEILGDVVKEVVSKQVNGKNGSYQKDAIILHGDMRAVITIWRKDWTNPFVHEVYLEEYAQPNEMWASKPRTMLKKVAITQGFRMAFPLEICATAHGEEEITIRDAEFTVTTPRKEDVKPTSSINDEVRKELKTALECAGLNTRQMGEFAAFYALDLKTNLEHVQTVQHWLSNVEFLDEKIDKFLDSLSLPTNGTEDNEHAGDLETAQTAADELF